MEGEGRGVLESPTRVKGEYDEESTGDGVSEDESEEEDRERERDKEEWIEIGW